MREKLWEVIGPPPNNIGSGIYQGEAGEPANIHVRGLCGLHFLATQGKYSDSKFSYQHCRNDKAPTVYFMPSNPKPECTRCISEICSRLVTARPVLGEEFKDVPKRKRRSVGR